MHSAVKKILDNVSVLSRECSQPVSCLPWPNLHCAMDQKLILRLIKVQSKISLKYRGILAESNISHMISEEKSMDAGGDLTENRSSSGIIEDGTTAEFDNDTGRENHIESRRVDKIEGEEGEIIAEVVLGVEDEPQEKNIEQRGECEFVEEIKKSDDEGEYQIQVGEGGNEIYTKMGFDKDNKVKVDGEDEIKRGEESDDDISTEDNVNHLEEGGRTHVTLESQVEIQVEESGVNDNVTDIVTPALKLLIFNILMPCIDIYFDSSLIIRLYPHFWGCILVIVSGFLLHFIFTCFAWWRLEPIAQKKWSWIFLLLQIWPQIKAIQVIKQFGPFHLSACFVPQALWLTLRRDPDAEKARATLDREVSSGYHLKG